MRGVENFLSLQQGSILNLFLLTIEEAKGTDGVSSEF
jgi:hypothetical protein